MHVDLPADLTAAGVARDRARTVLGRWRLQVLVEPLTLAVSELVGNAVRHGRPPVDMMLRRVGNGVRVEVHDEDPAEPAATAGLPDLDAESGRGNFLVESVATNSGVQQIPGDGKIA